MKTILITGASSGIGRALALHYAKNGVRLALAGRNLGRLEEVAVLCRAKGAEVHSALIDVTSADIVGRWIHDLDRRFVLDMVIANAGISGGTGGIVVDELPAQAREIFSVNFEGVLNTIHPVLPAMMRRGQGQLVIMSSLAGIVPLPGAPAYSASKAAIRYYGEALHSRLKPFGVDVSVVCPGFVESAMTAANPFPMPFLLSVERAACLIAKGLEAKKMRISFPWPMVLAMRLLLAVPPALRGRLLAKVPEKPAKFSS